MLEPLRLEIAALPAAGSPLTLPHISFSDLKDRLRFEAANQDELLRAYWLAAIQWAEAFTHRSVLARTHTWVLRDFPRYGRQEIRLPRGKTQSVTSIAYVLSGSTTTLTGSSSSPVGTGYQEDFTGEDGGLLMPLRNEDWPDVDYDSPVPVKITFSAGWADGEAPEDAMAALVLRTSFLLDEDESYAVAAERLMSSYMLPRLY